MTSFAKVCIDLSNNLRNLRFGKSSTQPAINTNATAADPSPGLSPGHNHVTAVCYSPASDPFTHYPLGGGGTPNGTKNGSPTLPPKMRLHRKKQAPPVPPKTNKCLLTRTTSATSSEAVHSSDPIVELMQSSNLISHLAPGPDPQHSHLPEPNVTAGFSKDSVHSRPVSSSEIRGTTMTTMSNGMTTRLLTPGSPTAPYRRTTSTITPRSDEMANGGLSPRFTSRLTFSPTMAHRVATLARNYQYNYGGSEASSVKSGASSNCSSPIMPHRGATVAAIKQRLLSQGLKIDLRIPPKKFTSTRYRDYIRRVQRGRPITVEALWEDERVLSRMFEFLSGRDLLKCCAVCRTWFQLIARLSCLDRVMITLNVKRLWTDAVREQMVEDSPAVHMLNYSSARSLVSEENAPVPVSWTDQRLERKLIERLNAGVRRGIHHLCVVQMADRYAQILLNAIMTVLYDCANPDATLPKSLSQTTGGPTVSNDSFSSKPRCRLSISGESRQPLAHIQSFTLSPITPRQNPTTTTTAETLDPSLPHYFSTLNVATNITSDSTLSALYANQNEGIHPHANSQLDSQLGLRPTRSSLSKSPIHIFYSLTLRCCSIVDNTMEQLVRLLPGLRMLEFQCCNELSELAFWTCLVPTIVHLRIFDCINVSDESIGAITQMLPDLKRLTLQAYHVTDAAFSYFSSKQRVSIESVRLTQCMDVTNQGLINLAFALPGLVQLSVSGCTNLTDDGLEVICENLRQLRQLDLSWCSKITDHGMEYIASYLDHLQRLILDRCASVTDIGIGHLTALSQLRHLSLRWCANLSDAMIAHLLGMTRLTYLSVAGCKRVSEEGICQLARHPRLRQLELIHCPGASNRVKAYLNENLTDCRLID